MEQHTPQTDIPDYAPTERELVIDFRTLFMDLLDKLVIILLAVGITFFGAFLLGKYVLPLSYTSTTSIYVLPRTTETQDVSYSDLQAGSQLTMDYIEIIQSNSVLQDVIDHFEIDTTVKKFAKKVSVTNPDDTRLLEISVEDKDPVNAKLYADYLRDVAMEKILSDTEVTNISVEDRANLPTQQDISALALAVLAAAVMAVLSVCIAVVHFFVNDRLVTADDVESRMNLTVLGSIPMEEKRERRSGGKKRDNRKKGGRQG